MQQQVARAESTFQPGLGSGCRSAIASKLLREHGDRSHHWVPLYMRLSQPGTP
jgi:hypothetical protein